MRPVWKNEAEVVLPPAWVNTERESQPSERTVVLAQVCEGIECSWWEKTSKGFVERHKTEPQSPVRRAKMVTLSKASEVVGIDYASMPGYSQPADDFQAAVAALLIEEPWSGDYE